MKKKVLYSITMSATLLFSLTTQANDPIAKQLAGPPEEIELMQKSSPQSSAIISKTALIRIELQQSKSSQWQWNTLLNIDGENPKILLFTKDSNNWQLNISQNGSNQILNIDDFVSNKTATTYGIESQKYPAVQFDLKNINKGSYNLTINSQNPVETDGFVLFSSDSPYKLKSYVASPGQLVGDVISVNAQAFTEDSDSSMLKNDLQLINESFLVIRAPDGSVFTRQMFDDGINLDKSSNDGEFVGQFIAEQQGLYQVQVKSTGITPSGLPFLRTVEHLIPVVFSDLKLESKYAIGAYTANNKIGFDFNIATEQKDANFRVIAEIWGTKVNEKKQQQVAISWVSTITQAVDGSIKLEIDDRWLNLANVSAPYELKNIRIEDTSYFIPMLEIESLPLQLPDISSLSKSSFDGNINESMLKGERPKISKITNKSSGGKLMLVHGYCSSDVWGPVQGQFSNSVKFSDFNQNRSHDTFARMIDTFGNNYESFGIVAHSQGGAAALHLYTYYWSGLDWAGSGRLIQSLGTPYQGTPLAGNLAALGSVFGVGCGYNSNLTTSGANSWLSGIPTWARSKVNYYTTSFTDKWWRYDYCSLATDLFLSDPEDGVTERSRGQLSGASNRGHKTGQCHTSGMRDGAQTKDSGRNSTMNSNAAR
ncbi:MAG: conditioned medium factor [Proteobacteria bacterium]|nr:conditioned medium factor [Pseudomonadota bacterium]